MNAQIQDSSSCLSLPGAVVKVGVPRGPGAVEGKGLSGERNVKNRTEPQKCSSELYKGTETYELLVVLVLLTPHPKSLEHLFCSTENKRMLAMRAFHSVHAHDLIRKKLHQNTAASLHTAASFSCAALAMSTASSSHGPEPKPSQSLCAVRSTA